MKAARITVAKILDTRYSLVSSKFTIKIRVTFTILDNGKKTWKQKHYPTNHSATMAEFEMIKANPKIRRLKLIKMEIEELENKAKRIIKEYPTATIGDFEDMFVNNIRPITNLTKVSELTVPEFESILKRVISDALGFK